MIAWRYIPPEDGAVERIALPLCAIDARAAPLPGETIREFVDRNGWERGAPLACYEIGEDGRPLRILRAEWSRPADLVRPVFATMPLGGGGGGGSQGALAVVAMIALMVVANFAAAAIGGAIGLGVIGVKIIAALIVVGGGLLISHFMRPKQPANPPPVHDFALSGNMARPGQPIPVQYGRLKFTPDFSDAPYTDYSGVKSTFHALFCLGVGEYEVEEIGVHQTPIWTAAHGLAAGFGGAIDKSVTAPAGGWGDNPPAGVRRPDFEFEIVGPGEPVTLFPTNIAAAPDVSGQTLPDPWSAGNVGPNGERSGWHFLGPFSVNPPDTIARRLAFDVAWPGGSYATRQNGDTIAGISGLIFQVRRIDGQGQAIGDWVELYNQSITFLSKTTYRRSYEFDVAPGRYEARASRRGATNTSNGANSISLLAVRAFCDGPSARPHVTQIAVRARADALLSGYNQQALYVIATRKIRVWNGATATWVEQTTRNPLWAVADLWADPRYGGALDRNDLDIPAFAAQAAASDARGDTFDHRFTSRTTLIEALGAVLQSIRAQPLPLWNRLSVVRDEPRAMPRAQISDFEIIRGSYRATWRLAAAFPSSGVVGQYFDETTWRMAEVSSTGSLADMQNPTRVVLHGVTRRAQAYDLVVYLDRVNRYRRATHVLELEGEGHLLRRGDLVRVSTELPGRYGVSVRIESYDPVTRALTVHAPLDWSAVGMRYIAVKSRLGASFGPVKCSRGAADDILIVDAADLALVEAQQSSTLVDALWRRDDAEPPTGSVSVGAPQELLALVHSLAPGSQEGHISVDLAPYAADQVFAPLAPLPALPPPPQIVLPDVPGAIVGLGASLQQEQAALTLRASWQPDRGSETYEAEYSLDDGASWAAVYSGAAAEFDVKGFSGADLTLRVRGARGPLRSIAWSQIFVPAPQLSVDLVNLGAVVGYDVLAPDLADRLHLDPAQASDEALAALMGEIVARDRQHKEVRATGAATSASIVETQTAVASDIAALAASTLQLTAANASGTAAVEMKAMASADAVAAGLSASWSLRVATQPNGAGMVESGIRIEVLPDGSTRIVLDASKTYFGSSATKFVPFIVDAISNEVIMQGVTKVASAVKSLATVSSGDPVMELDFVNGRLSISQVPPP